MKLVVGLGNPGKDYEFTRHNIGFMTLDYVAEKQQLHFVLEPRLKGMLASMVVNGHKTLFLKPMTYMNLSGDSVIAVMNYYKINREDILIISDDLDSKLGRVRIRQEGSAGGHNGHKSIIAQLHSMEYKRIKIGIDRSPVIPVIDWVLQRFNEEERAVVNGAIEKAYSAIMDFASDIPFYKIASQYSSK